MLHCFEKLLFGNFDVKGAPQNGRSVQFDKGIIYENRRITHGIDEQLSFKQMKKAIG